MRCSARAQHSKASLVDLTVAKHYTGLATQKHVVLYRVVLGAIDHDRVERAVEKKIPVNTRSLCRDSLAHPLWEPTARNLRDVVDVCET